MPFQVPLPEDLKNKQWTFEQNWDEHTAFMRASGRSVQLKELMIEVGKEHIYNHKFCQKRKLPSPESEASSRPTGKQLTQQKQENITEDKDGGTGSTASASEISVMVGKVDKEIRPLCAVPAWRLGGPRGALWAPVVVSRRQWRRLRLLTSA